MKKFLKIFVPLLILAVFIGTFVFLYLRSLPQEVVYDEFEVTVGDISKTTVVTGKIEPRDEVNVKPQISGIITQIMKEAGDVVTAGEVIAKVKVIPDMAQLSNAESRVRLATVNLQQAQTDYEREKVLFDKGLVSADEYDKIAQVWRQAKEEKNAATDALEVVRDGVSRSNAKA
ncbi:MAG: efflux transporter periplasmic adaptor subunit, partial [Prevotella sp.]|nr:efflux transporter periplasmic adaptor subunit [Prevotella sp.]